jgi:hypothetical protein
MPEMAPDTRSRLAVSFSTYFRSDRVIEQNFARRLLSLAFH